MQDELQDTQKQLEQAQASVQQLQQETAALKERLSTEGAAASKAQETAAAQAVRMREQHAALQVWHTMVARALAPHMPCITHQAVLHPAGHAEVKMGFGAFAERHAV